MSALLLTSLVLLACPADDSSEGGGGEGGGPPVEPVHMDPEAGFLEVEGVGLNERSRIFYSFIPADEHPEDAPLMVYFNGGPGTATTRVLAPFGTGPFTLLPDDPPDAPPVENETSHSRFANLLYVDASGAGYSYDLGAKRCDQAPTVRDAASFLYVILTFLDGHAPLVDNPVVLVGESYGGTRATLMLYMLQHYTGEVSLPGAPEFLDQVPWLPDRMRQHLALARGSDADVSAAEVARQFGHQVLIQPNIFGATQIEYQQTFIAEDERLAPYLSDPERDHYDVRRSEEEGLLLLEHSARAMRNPEQFELLFQVPMSEVPLLGAADRGEVVRIVDVPYTPTEVFAEEVALHAELGALEALDAYWLPHVLPCSGFLGDVTVLTAFVDVLARTETFITNARYDSIVYSKALAYFVDEMSELPGEIDETEPRGAARPGQMRIGESTKVIRFPSYESGHEVSIGAPRELAEDVEAWLRATGAVD